MNIRRMVRCRRNEASCFDRDGERGQTMILIIGYVVLTLLVVSVVTGASAVYIGHKKLLSVADSAAAAAADSFSLGTASETNEPVVSLDREQVRSVVQRYLKNNVALNSFDELTISAKTGTDDARSATVTLGAIVHPPIINFLIPAGISISATSTARPQLRR